MQNTGARVGGDGEDEDEHERGVEGVRQADLKIPEWFVYEALGVRIEIEIEIE